MPKAKTHKQSKKEKLDAVLTPEQRKKMKKLLSEATSAGNIQSKVVHYDYLTGMYHTKTVETEKKLDAAVERISSLKKELIASFKNQKEPKARAKKDVLTHHLNDLEVRSNS